MDVCSPQHPTPQLFPLDALDSNWLGRPCTAPTPDQHVSPVSASDVAPSFESRGHQPSSRCQLCNGAKWVNRTLFFHLLLQGCQELIQPTSFRKIILRVFQTACDKRTKTEPGTEPSTTLFPVADSCPLEHNPWNTTLWNTTPRNKTPWNTTPGTQPLEHNPRNTTLWNTTLWNTTTRNTTPWNTTLWNTTPRNKTPWNTTL